MTKNTKAVAKEIVAAAPAVAAVVVPAAAPTKADKAREIFAACYGESPVPARKDIISRMIDGAGLTKAGAATYLQNMKKKAGLVTAKAPASVPQAA